MSAKDRRDRTAVFRAYLMGDRQTPSPWDGVIRGYLLALTFLTEQGGTWLRWVAVAVWIFVAAVEHRAILRARRSYRGAVQ